MEGKERIVSQKSRRGDVKCYRAGWSARRISPRGSPCLGSPSPSPPGELGTAGPRAELLQERGTNVPDNSSTARTGSLLGGIKGPHPSRESHPRRARGSQWPEGRRAVLGRGLLRVVHVHSTKGSKRSINAWLANTLSEDRGRR